ncbi:acyloxyacyl hydrolase [Luteolibacter pohnpeiensis]|uniref:Acyloxyacyl hydrolase n=1 Tax=Luteolibacter pohnpeiensis TaxID=454153 RepID=A0A934S7M5_9BACT|nr:acyloxyacyl hydrolase [Luteolibacter pohnpeiensis]MBK1883333.1 acyloxyacyl hydrolase [Luteolibacter pohnpeiensis]
MKSVSLIAIVASLAAAGTAISHPADEWEYVLESGFLRNVGHNTDIDYEIIPTQLTFRSPAVWTPWESDSGAKLVVRHRVSALFESFIKGPEDYYVGVAAAPSLEYWFPSEKTSLFLSLGGGVGFTNSSGGEQGQGQDFTLNWFSQLGIRQQLCENVSILGGAYFLHHSNGGQTDPNPGIDAFGMTVGLGWKF